LTTAEYEALGGLGRVLASEADAVLDAVRRDDPTAFALLPGAFVRMSRLGEGGVLARAASNREDHPLAVRATLRRFVNKRILMSRGENGVDRVEIAAEALFRTWAPLAQWLDEQIDVLRLVQFLRDGVSRFSRDGDEADLLRGPRLARIKELAQELLAEQKNREASSVFGSTTMLRATWPTPSMRPRISRKLKYAGTPWRLREPETPVREATTSTFHLFLACRRTDRLVQISHSANASKERDSAPENRLLKPRISSPALYQLGYP
jgi:hypothetical protein